MIQQCCNLKNLRYTKTATLEFWSTTLLTLLYDEGQSITRSSRQTIKNEKQFLNIIVHFLNNLVLDNIVTDRRSRMHSCILEFNSRPTNHGDLSSDGNDQVCAGLFGGGDVIECRRPNVPPERPKEAQYCKPCADSNVWYAHTLRRRERARLLAKRPQYLECAPGKAATP